MDVTTGTADERMSKLAGEIDGTANLAVLAAAFGVGMAYAGVGLGYLMAVVAIPTFVIGKPIAYLLGRRARRGRAASRRGEVVLYWFAAATMVAAGLTTLVGVWASPQVLDPGLLGVAEVAIGIAASCGSAAVFARRAMRAAGERLGGTDDGAGRD